MIKIPVYVVIFRKLPVPLETVNERMDLNASSTDNNFLLRLTININHLTELTDNLPSVTNDRRDSVHQKLLLICKITIKWPPTAILPIKKNSPPLQ